MTMPFRSHSAIAILLLFGLALGFSTAVPAQPGAVGEKPATAERTAYYVRHSGEHAATAEARVRELGGEVMHRFDRVRSFAVTLPEAAAKALAARPEIELVEPVPEHRLAAQVVPWNIDQYQARDIWDQNRDGVIDPGAPDGSLLKFCIIDTGFFAAHDDFQGITASGVSQITGENWFEDGNGHGTHVAGTANAVNNSIGVVGATPGGAELFIVKVFNNAGDWVNGQSNLGAAATACRDAGANVISMSLGGGFSATEQAIFQDLYDNSGILNVAAAGNDGNMVESYPASYPSVISVAAIDEAELAAEFSQFPPTANDPDTPPANVEWDVVELSGGGVQVLSTFPFPNGNVPAFQAIGTQTWNGGHIDESGLGDVTGVLVDGGLCAPGSGGPGWNGAVVICERGSVSFADKVNEVRNNGGLAAIIFNNVAGGFSGTCSGGCSAPLIPAISLSQADGLALIADDLGAPVNVVADDGSGCVGCTGGYDFLSGTSMATPGVAAAVALAWDACGGPASVTNKQVRQLLRDSARDLSGTKPGSNFVYGAGYDQVTGWGLVQLADARALGNQRFGGACPLGLEVAPVEAEVCTADGSTDFTLTLSDQFQGSATLSSGSLPAGTSGGFSPNPVVDPVKTSVFTLSNLAGASNGTHALEFTATDDGDSSNVATGQAVLTLVATAPGAITTLSPGDGALDVNPKPMLSWTADAVASSYEIQIAEDPAFANIVYTATETGTSHQVAAELASDTTHYWRVRAANVCGDGGWSNTARFTTATLSCTTVASTDVGKPIADATNQGGGTPQSTDSVLTSTLVGALDSVEVLDMRGTHTWINDLSFDLVSPAGTSVRVMDRSCNNEDDFFLSFDDAATNPAGSWPCPPLDQATYQPSNALSTFDGEAAAGTWTLRITDHVSQDSGTIDGWGLRLCSLLPSTPPPASTITTIISITPPGSQTFNQPYTVEVSVSGDNPGGTVQIGDGAAACQFTLPASSCALTSTSVGIKTITADYSGDPANLPSSDSTSYEITPAAASVALGNLSQVFDGTPKPVTATTDPAGLTVDITYDSQPTAPTDVGSYAVVATINEPNYTGSASGTLEITPAAASVALGNLSQVFDGTPKPVTATTDPAGLTVDITYDGQPTAPTDVGSYAVVATINEPNYTGSASGTLEITAPVSPVLVLMPSSVDFGDVDPGQSSGPIVVVLENTGNGEAMIQSIGLNGANNVHFQRSADPGFCQAGDVLAPDTFCGIELRYQPQSGGLHEVILSVTAQSGTNDQIPVRGSMDIMFMDSFEAPEMP